MKSAGSLAARAVLAVGLMFGFYAMAIGVAGALLYVSYAEIVYGQRIRLSLTFFCVAGGFTILWSIFPRVDRFRPPGPMIEPAGHPRLFEEIEDIAQRTGQAMPEQVFLAGDVNAWVAQRGGIMGFFSRRVMGLGLPLLQTLSVSELRAVIAHEFGHYHHGDTRLGPWIYKTRDAIGRTVTGLGDSILQLPFGWYGSVFLRITRAVSRRQELNADELASRVAGSRPLIEGLKKTQAAARVFDSFWSDEVVPVLSAGFVPPIADGFRRFSSNERVARAMEGIVRHEIEQAGPSPFDTHPPLPERIAAVAQLPAGPDPACEPAALSLLSDVPQLERSWLMTVLDPSRAGALEAIAWEDVVPRVFLPIWRGAVEQNSDALAEATIGGLADVIAETEERCLRLQLGEGVNDTRSVRVVMLRRLVGIALVVALEKGGWRIGAPPGDPVSARRGDTELRPFEIVGEVLDRSLSADAWRARATELGVQDLPLAGAPAMP